MERPGQGHQEPRSEMILPLKRLRPWCRRGFSGRVDHELLLPSMHYTRAAGRRFEEIVKEINTDLEAIIPGMRTRLRSQGVA